MTLCKSRLGLTLPEGHSNPTTTSEASASVGDRLPLLSVTLLVTSFGLTRSPATVRSTASLTQAEGPNLKG